MIKSVRIIFQIFLLITIGLLSEAQVWKEPYFEPNELAQNFSQNGQQISFLFDENVKPDSTLGYLNYDGASTPDLINSDFYFFKLEEEDGKFVLKNVIAFDYEKITEVSFKIILGEILVSFEVIINNLNDNPLYVVFPKEPCIIMENLEPHKTKCSYEIRDEDGIDTKVQLSNLNHPALEIKWDGKYIGEKSATVFVYTNVTLDFEEKQFYFFKWFVWDKEFNNCVPTVIINVEDAPDTPPIWKDIFESKEIREHSSSKHSVVAIDGDFAINDDIKYECLDIPNLLKEEIICYMCSDGDFCIDIKNIDRDENNINEINFKIMAKEDNAPYYNRTQEVSLIITDINDNCPEITIFDDLIIIRENEYASMGDLRNEIYDKDLGKNAVFNISLESTVENFTAAVQIIPTIGYKKTHFSFVVSNASILDFDRTEAMRDFDFYVVVNETVPAGCNPVTQKIHMQLINWNDEKPIFQKDKYSIEIYETFGRETVEKLLIADLYALDADYGDEVSYQILGHAVDDILEIDDFKPPSGMDVIFKTKEPKSEDEQIFDYERSNEVIIQLKAQDNFPGSEIINTAVSEITIKILDANDETPSISITQQSTRLDENVPDATIITNNSNSNIEITVVDEDTNAELNVYIDWDESYATKNGHKVAWDKYKGWIVLKEINDKPNGRNGTYIMKTEEVVTKNTPDFELFDTMYLRIVVEDQKQVVGEGKASLMFVINVNNLNDRPPKFIQSTIEAKKTVIEHSRPGTAIGTLMALDEDIDTVITYSIGSSDYKDLIELNKDTGEISVNKDIDADLPLYVLNYTVDASDGKFHDTAEITITIIDINDLPPNFDELIDDVSIEEHSKVGAVINNVNATDKDRDEPNNVIKYYLNNDPMTNTFFLIDEDSGEITIKDDGLDRDQGPTKYEIVIIIKDNPTNNGVQNTNVTSFKVTLIDINDSPPIIDTETLPTIDEQIKKDDVIGIIEAHDDDEKGNDNSKIKFDILSITSLGENKLTKEDFIISTDEDHTSWRGTIKSLINLEGYYGEYLLEIKTEDLGQPPLSYTKNVTLTIEEYNFYPPNFTFPNESILLLAVGIGVGEKVLTSYLTDLPPFKAISDPRGKYYTKVELMDYTDIFELKLSGHLQYRNLPDETRDYQLTIKATDDGIPSRSITTEIIIKFRDFGVEPSYKITDMTVYFDELACNETVSTATADINADIVYYHLFKDPSDAFLVDKLTGDLTITKSLVRENFTDPFITIAASHFDKPPTNPSKNSTLNVKVELQSVNYRPPFFLSNEYFGGIMTSTVVGSKILSVEARDKDENDTLTYRILEDTFEAIGEGISTDLTFNINKINNEKADIQLGFAVESNMKGRFIFKVEVSDGVHVADTSVTIIIISETRQNIKYYFGNEVPSKDDIEKFEMVIETLQNEE